MAEHLPSKQDVDGSSPFARFLQFPSEAILHQLMSAAFEQAREGMARGEAPIGCVIARADGTIIGRGHNRMNQTQNKTAHAEMVAFADAAGKVPLDERDLILVSTLEPCVMCTGAAMEAAVGLIVYALKAPADAGTGRVKPPESPESANPKIVGDVRSAESLELFKTWYELHKDEPQAAYIGQLLRLHGVMG
jgi:tRNA(Ile)-lysidine synthase